MLVWGPGASLDTGALFVAAACVAWGLDNSVTARIDQLSPEHVVFLKGFVAGTANLCLGLLFATSGPSVSVAEITAALVIGATGYGASIVLWVKGARDLGAARGQVIFATAPFIGALIAWIVLRETATGTQVLAVAIAAIGVGVSLKSAHAHEHDHDQIEHEHEHHHDDGHHDHHGGNEAMRDVSHTHRHLHRRVTHSHPHVPDLHHRHH